MKVATGRERYRCISVSLGGFGRSRAADHVILELEEQDDDTGLLSWRSATCGDITKETDAS